ncbi:hypothetical protein D3C83_81020 [compost metagenome]
MHVEVLLDPGPGGGAKVHSDVDPLKLVGLTQRQLRALCQQAHLVHLLPRQAGEARFVPVRHDH